jgi:hypothetical protein
MTAPVRIIFVGIPEVASNKRVYRPQPAQVPGKRRDLWPLSQHIPDEMRREHDAVRRDIAASRPAIERWLRTPGP